MAAVPSHGVGTAFTQLYALAFAEAASENIAAAAFTIARLSVSGVPLPYTFLYLQRA